MRMPAAFALALCLTVLPHAALAWGPTGHRITAKIAEDNMDPAAHAKMQEITGARSLALLSHWPDFVRTFAEFDCLKPWHFLTVEDGQDIAEALLAAPFVSGGCDRDSFERLGMPKNVVEAIGFFTAVLEGDAAKTAAFAEMLGESGAEPMNGSVTLTALALLVHLVGDVHQPLHVGRGPDRGGNTITVDFFGEMKNLHEVWDEDMIDRELLSYTEFASFLSQEFSDAAPVEFGAGPVDWALESVSHRGAIYDFGGNPNFNVPKLSYPYADGLKPLLHQRLYQGGMRLAEILNRVFGG